MFDRAILHLDLDAFFVSVERLRNRALAGRPLIIGGRSARGVVASCSYEARAFGVRSAMPIRTALQLCPEALVLRGDLEAYERYSALITEIIAEESPLFEKASIDEFYLDLTGMDRYFGCWQWSRELRSKVIRESGLPLSAGLAVNKLVSKVGAGEAKPNGEKIVAAGEERAFLAPLPVRKLPMVGRMTARKLSLMGVRDLATLSRLPPRLLEREFGKLGPELWRRANGIDDRPVVPYHDRRSISTEHTFQVDTIDPQVLHDQLARMVTRLAFDLRQRGKLTAEIAVKIRYSDFNTFSKQRRIACTAGDNRLLAHARELFDALFTRRQLVRLVGVRFGKLVSGTPQLDLFDPQQEDERLIAAMDHIRRRFGKEAVGKANTFPASGKNR